MSRAQAGRYGIQPCKVHIVPRSAYRMIDSRCGHGPSRGRIPEAAALLSEHVGHEVKSRTLRAWLDGYSVPPAEVKLGLAQILGLPPEQCWTPSMMEMTHTGPRGFTTPT